MFVSDISKWNHYVISATDVSALVGSDENCTKSISSPFIPLSPCFVFCKNENCTEHILVRLMIFNWDQL